PVLVDGPWAAPRFAPDLEGLATGLLKDPEGALDAGKSLLKTGGGGAAGALGSAVESLGGAALPGLGGGDGAAGAKSDRKGKADGKGKKKRKADGKASSGGKKAGKAKAADGGKAKTKTKTKKKTGETAPVADGDG
ncbi:MAG: hypothetical protein AAF192_00200, partial [Pseudomonadota bacterium]